MTAKELFKLKYPIGKFKSDGEITLEQFQIGLNYLERFPEILINTVTSLDNDQLNTPYRPGGWTIRQVIHHLPDSHVNAYVRMKLAATEETPTILPYNESAWAELGDGKLEDIRISLQLLNGLHRRWVSFIKNLNTDQLNKGYYHPADQETVSIRKATCLYDWHSKHHLAHIQNLIFRENW